MGSWITTASRPSRLALTIALGLSLATASRVFAQNPCQVTDNGSGTVTLPPAGCQYLSPSEVHMIIDGLPPGTTIELSPIHLNFINVVNNPGGTLGGDVETFDSTLQFEANGTGSLSGFARTIQIPVAVETHTAPRLPGDPVQSFDTDMFRISGELFGDPDFCTLRINAGTDNGLPSPGRTTLTQLPSGDFNVDSFFDIEYQIEFQGCPGSVLDGFAGTTTDTIQMRTGEPTPPPCVVPDNGGGTVELPPPGCGYVSPADLHLMIDGLPPGTTIEIAPVHLGFFVQAQGPGGSLGGEFEQFDSQLGMSMQGTGQLAGFQRQIQLPLVCETHIGPRTPGDPVQSFPNDMFQLQGALFGDPDFDFLQVTGGTNFGLPSPGQTTLTQLPSGDFNVDSFFDITYQIDFVGAPGSVLDGLSGSTQGNVRMQASGIPQPGACCLEFGCIDQPTEQCFEAGGEPQGSGTSCSGTVIRGNGGSICAPTLTTTTSTTVSTTTTTPPPTTSTTGTTSTTVTATTTTTMPSPPCVCGDPVLPGASLLRAINATDALFSLQAGVGAHFCDPCACDVNDSGAINATDALIILQFGVGQPVVLSCPSS